MSYLLDALRKAERERNLGRVPDLGLQSNEALSSTGKSLPAWALAAVGALVALNLLVLAVFWWSTGQREHAPISPPETRADKVAAAPETPKSVNKPVPPAAVVEKSPDTAQPPAGEPAADEFADYGSDDATEFDYDDAPAVSNESAIPEYRALPPKQRAQVPDLHVNGHLYSSIPGRSFVLINGRRYHEGQRLAEGPAVVLVDKAGAIFKYGDIRFRLDAPR